MTVFTDLEAALEELNWLVEQTGKTHLLKHHTRGKYKVVREYINSHDDKLIARLSQNFDFRDFLQPQLQKVIGRIS